MNRQRATRFLTGVHPSADSYLEHGLPAPFTARPLWIGARMVAFGVSGVIAAFVTWLPNRPLVVALFVLTTALQPLLPKLFGNQRTALYQSATDFVVIAALMLAAPGLWAPAMAWVGATIAWQAIALPTRAFVPIGVLAVGAVSLSGYFADVQHWWTASIVIVLLGAPLAVHGRQLRLEFRNHEQDLMVSLSRAGAIVHHTNLGAGAVSQVIGDIEALTGWTPEEWCETDHRSIIHPDDLEAFWVHAEDVHDGTLLDRSCRMRRADGSWVWIRDISRVGVDRRGGKSLRGFSLDITALEESTRAVAAQARLDPLTGLPNRLALNERLAASLETATDFALMIIDLDRFKEVNDTLGHEAGDQLLAVVAERIARTLDPADMLARLGGDEFAIVVAGATEAADVQPVIDRISVECVQPVSLRSVRVATSMSVGIAFNALAGDDRATIMRHADIAMYAAKRAGKLARFFDESLEQTSTVHLSLSAAVPAAIIAGDVELYFQPKIDLATRAVIGAEGLARWQHPEHGLLGPGAFLEIATMSETSSLFARTMIVQGVEMAQRLIDAGRPLPIAVNITMRALQEDDFSTWLLAALARHDVPPHLLVLELTEQDVRDPSAQVEAVLRELSDAGIELSIDDFGTGHSSLQRLRELSVDELKIDRAFVEGIGASSVDREIVGSIIALANRLGYRVVAEGVEHAGHAEMLLDMGCGVAQGYLFAAALPADAFVELAVTGDELTHTASIA